MPPHILYSKWELLFPSCSTIKCLLPVFVSEKAQKDKIKSEFVLWPLSHFIFRSPGDSHGLTLPYELWHTLYLGQWGWEGEDRVRVCTPWDNLGFSLTFNLWPTLYLGQWGWEGEDRERVCTPWDCLGVHRHWPAGQGLTERPEAFHQQVTVRIQSSHILQNPWKKICLIFKALKIFEFCQIWIKSFANFTEREVSVAVPSKYILDKC